MQFNKFKKRNRESDPFAIKTGKYKRVEGISYRQMWTEGSFVEADKGKETIGRTFNISKVFIIIYP